MSPRCTSIKHPIPERRFVAASERLDLRAAYDRAARATVERIAAAGGDGRPRAMKAFDSLLVDDWRREEIERSGRPVVGYFCNFVPDELILAAGAIPLRLELGESQAVEAGARLLPTDTCPEIKAIVGAELGGLPYVARADLLVVPTSCDGKRKLATLLGDRREVFSLHLPHSQRGGDLRRRGGGGASIWLEQLRALVKRTEKLSGQRVRRGTLAAAVSLINRRSAAQRRLQQLRLTAGPGALSGRDMFLVMQASFIADPAWWVERVEELITELAAAKDGAGRADRSEGPLRVLLTGSPVFFPDLSLLDLIEDSGGEIVADELCSGTQRLYSPAVVDERTKGGLIRAAAERTLLPCTCPCFVESDHRIDRLLELASQSRADGVVYHTLRLCQLYDLEHLRVSEVLRGRGLPVLQLHTEMQGGAGQAVLKNRLEAFYEMLGDS